MNISKRIVILVGLVGPTALGAPSVTRRTSSPHPKAPAKTVATPAARRPAQAPIRLVEDASLLGSWTSPCLPSPPSKITYSFAPKTAVITIESFFDSACSRPSFTVDFLYNYGVDPRPIQTPAGAKAFNAVLTSARLTPKDATFAEHLSAGYHMTLSSGVTTDVSGKGGMPRRGYRLFSIYQVGGSELSVGEYDGVSPETRPTKFAKTTFQKQKK